jgi:hypothetical protein
MSMRSCGCLPKVAKLLAARNTRLVTTWPLVHGTPARAVIRTEQIETGRWKTRASAMIASFCPFCGKEYPCRPPTT